MVGHTFLHYLFYKCRRLLISDGTSDGDSALFNTPSVANIFCSSPGYSRALHLHGHGYRRGGANATWCGKTTPCLSRPLPSCLKRRQNFLIRQKNSSIKQKGKKAFLAARAPLLPASSRMAACSKNIAARAWFGALKNIAAAW